MVQFIWIIFQNYYKNCHLILFYNLFLEEQIPIYMIFIFMKIITNCNYLYNPFTNCLINTLYNL